MQIILCGTRFRLYWVPVFKRYGDVRPSAVHLWITMDRYGVRRGLLIADVHDDGITTSDRSHDYPRTPIEAWYAVTIYEPTRFATEIVVVDGLASAKQILLTRVLVMLQSEFIMAAVLAQTRVQRSGLPENLEWCVNADAYQ